MRPAFSQALFYPFMDIHNSSWLKTSTLFWDSISTIAPKSIKNPYKYNDSKFLADVGFLKPIIINSSSESAVEIENEIIKIMYTKEFFNLVNSPKGREVPSLRPLQEIQNREG